MPNGSSDLYEFGPFRLDVRRRTLAREERAIALAPKTFELLVLMVRNSGRALSKQELMTALWPDTFVEETNLSFQISTLRKALGEAGATFIETVPKHGYRFGSQVSAVAEPEAEAIPRDHFPGTIPPEPPGPDRPTGKRWLAVGTASAALAVASYIALGSKQVPASTLHPGAPTPLTAYSGIREHT